MRKLLSCLAFVFVLFIPVLFIPVCLAYEPTTKDVEDLNNLKKQLDVLVSGNNIDLWNFYNQISNLQTDYSVNPRLDYMLGELRYYLYSDTKNNKNALSKQKSDAKTLSKEAKKNFVLSNYTGLYANDENPLKNCTWWYKTLDDISFAYDFPTALTIAIWYRESTCSYYLPNNGYWPFQIMSKNYWTWEITQQQFVKTIVDFMEFSKNKLARYDWLLSGELTYSNFDLTWVSNFIALYNWGQRSWNVIIPNNMNYMYDWYWEDYSGSIKYWVLPEMLQVLAWEIDNQY